MRISLIPLFKRIQTMKKILFLFLLFALPTVAGVSNVGSRWENGNLRFFDTSNQETVSVLAPIYFIDDFLGNDFLDTESGSAGIWETVEVNLNTAIAVTAPSANGILRMEIDSDNNAEDAVLYFGDVRALAVNQGLVFEARIKFATVPTSNVTVVIGMAGAHNLDKDTITEGAWFRLDGSAALDVESDDTTNNNDDVTTGETLVAGTWYILKIDFTTLSDVGFFIDGDSTATGTTYDMSNLSTSEAQMQPYISLDKPNTGVATLDVDYIRIWGKRQ